jgi:hypothetical protein
MGAKLRIVWERYYCSENTNAVLPIKDLANQKIAYLKMEMQQTIHFIYIKKIYGSNWNCGWQFWKFTIQIKSIFNYWLSQVRYSLKDFDFSETELQN